MLDLESKEILKLIKAYFPQCFDKNGKLVAQRLKESIADFIAGLEVQKEFETQGELKAQKALEIHKSQSTQEKAQIHSQNLNAQFEIQADQNSQDKFAKSSQNSQDDLQERLEFNTQEKPKIKTSQNTQENSQAKLEFNTQERHEIQVSQNTHEKPEIKTSQNSQENSQAKPEFKEQEKPKIQAKLTQEKNIKESLSKESYALTWLGRSYARLMQRLPTNTLITQDYAHNKLAQNAHSKNVLIKGDNLEVLKHLKNAYYRKIKMIYIDPPYNTGKDFVYNDERDFTPQSLANMADISEDEAENILSKTLNKASSHSAWLSFMYPRLYLARSLLRDDGVIFISIDDNEEANLRLLCDNIFGEGNFVANLHIELSATQGMKVAAAQKGQIVKNAEYILVYAKSIENFSFTRPLYTAREWDDHYSIYINSQTKKRETLMDFLKPFYKDISQKKIVNMYQNDDDFRDFIHKNAKDIYRDAMIDLNFNFTQEDKDILDNGEILKYKEYLIFKTSTGVIRQLLSLEKAIGKTDDFEAKFGLRKIRGDWWGGFYKDMMNINKEGGVIFKNGKKPVRLIKDLLQISTIPNNPEFNGGGGRLRLHFA